VFEELSYFLENAVTFVFSCTWILADFLWFKCRGTDEAQFTPIPPGEL
jgi:hypothetical protein